MKVCAVQLNLKNCNNQNQFLTYIESEVFLKNTNADLFVFPENIKRPESKYKLIKNEMDVKTDDDFEESDIDSESENQSQKYNGKPYNCCVNTELDSNGKYIQTVGKCKKGYTPGAYC